MNFQRSEKMRARSELRIQSNTRNVFFRLHIASGILLAVLAMALSVPRQAMPPRVIMPMRAERPTDGLRRIALQYDHKAMEVMMVFVSGCHVCHALLNGVRVVSGTCCRGRLVLEVILFCLISWS